jgi:tetratricopeptide (TPR) repeat protein
MGRRCLPAGEVRVVPLPLALAMIVRDEAENLAVALHSVAGVASQIVVVDTGSTDNTREIAQSLGAEVYDFPWRDDFSAARNFALDQVRQPWVLVLDADEELVAEDVPALAAAIQEAAHAAFNLRVVSLMGDGNEVSEALVSRLFRATPDIRYEGAIHEQLIPSLRRHGLSMGVLDVRIVHTGYLQDVMQGRHKLERNRDLLLVQLEREPEDAYSHYQLGLCYLGLGQPEEAVRSFAEALRCSELTYELRPVFYLGLARAHTLAGRPSRAMRTVREALWHFPDYTDLEYFRGQLWLSMGRLQEAREAFLHCLQMGAPTGHLMSDAGVGSYQAKLGLAEAAGREGNGPEALAYALSALRDQPRWPRTWLFIARLTQGTPADVLVKHLRAALPDGELSRVLSLIPNLPPIYDEVRRIILG